MTEKVTFCADFTSSGVLLLIYLYNKSLRLFTNELILRFFKVWNTNFPKTLI